MVKIHLIQHQNWIQTESVILIQILGTKYSMKMDFQSFKCLPLFPHVRTIAEEVNTYLGKIKLYLTKLFTVVSGGSALIAATSVVGQLAPPALGAALLGLGGAVGGNMVGQNMCLGSILILS